MADMRLPFSIRPGTDSEASHYAKFGKGGYYSVSNEEEKLAIPQARLEIGLLVFVISTGLYWRYSSNGWVKQDFLLVSDSPVTETGEDATLIIEETNNSKVIKLTDTYKNKINAAAPLEVVNTKLGELKEEIIGTQGDPKTSDTLYGVKAYVDDLLTWKEFID